MKPTALVLLVLLCCCLLPALAQERSTRSVAAVAATPPPQTQATAAYIKFDGIDGEARDKDHKGWIDVLSVSQPKTGDVERSSARQRADVALGDITMTKSMDRSSSKLAEAHRSGRVFAQVEIHAPGADGRSMTYRLRNARISSYSTGGSGDRPTETITLSFARIHVSETAPPRAEKRKGNVESSWKVEEGEK